MSDVTYYFNAKGTDVWSDAAYIIDNFLTNYAYTSSDVIQLVNGNTCPGTNLGTITKVELRVYAYGDDNDRIDLTPVFGGSNDGDKHQTTPGVSPGSWGAYQDITEDTNSPAGFTAYESYTTGDDTAIASYQNLWHAQTFTPSSTHDMDTLKFKLYRSGSPGTVTVSIKATDVGGKPTGDDLVVTTFDGNTLTTDTDGEWKTITFSTSTSLSASIKYAIVIRCGGSASNAIMWRVDSSSPTYAGGSRCLSTDSGGTWSTSTMYDFMFEEGIIIYWSWSNVQSLDCKVEKDTVSKGNQMNCAKVEIRVTYTPIAGGVTRSYGFIFG